MKTKQCTLIPAAAPEPVDDVLDLADLPDSLDLIGPAPDAQMIASVARFGILSPIHVEAVTGGYRVLAGRRRIRAARAAGLKQIPARIYEPGDVPGDLLGLTEQAMRRPNPAADLAMIESLLAMRPAPSESEIAQATGLTVARIRQVMTLAGLRADLRDALDNGYIRPSVAFAAAKFPPPVQTSLAAIYAREGRLTAQDVQDVRRERTAAAAAALFQTMDAVAPIARPDPEPDPEPDPVDPDPANVADLAKRAGRQAGMTARQAAKLAHVLLDPSMNRRLRAYLDKITIPEDAHGRG